MCTTVHPLLALCFTSTSKLFSRNIHPTTYMQFKVYSGYYYILAVVFLFSGVYRISKTGCVRSFKLCWGRQHGTHSASVNEGTREPGDAKDDSESDDKPLLSQEGN